MNIDKKFILSIDKEKELNMMIQGLEMLRQKHESVPYPQLAMSYLPPNHRQPHFLSNSPLNLPAMKIITITTDKYEVEEALGFLKELRYYLKSQE